MRPLMMLVAGVAGARDRRGATQMPDTRLWRLSESRKSGQNVKEILPAQVRRRGDILISATPAITFDQGGF